MVKMDMVQVYSSRNDQLLITEKFQTVLKYQSYNPIASGIDLLFKGYLEFNLWFFHSISA